MTQKKIPLFFVNDKYPYNFKKIVHCLLMFLLMSGSVLCFFVFSNFFLVLLMGIISFLLFLNVIVLFQHCFSLDEFFLTYKDKKRFQNFCMYFPTKYKKQCLGHLDFDRVSLKDIKNLNKDIEKINKAGF